MALNRVFALIVWGSFSGGRPSRSVIPAQAGIFFGCCEWFYPPLPVVRSRFPPARE
ncbi:hypothetical protein HMPREF9120_02241 [Neisseria sp. oral taxon 020 str. F0370]|nr:hypothetical protein HMPREF9120_02241 [Neisseria sp. oral taxon 020 str. F0370]